MTRISTMGELPASLAHELNQPPAILSNAQAALRFMTSKPADLEEVREILQDIVTDDSRAGGSSAACGRWSKRYARVRFGRLRRASSATSHCLLTATPCYRISILLESSRLPAARATGAVASLAESVVKRI
jgi:hypothetical protein